MDKNLLLAVALSIGVYAIWFGYVEKKYPPAKPAAEQTAGTQGSETSLPTTSSPGQSLSAPGTDMLAGSDQVLFGDNEARISPRGAAIVSYKAKEPLGVVELVADPNPGFFAAWPDLIFKRLRQNPGLAYVAFRTDGLRIVKEFVSGDQNSLPRLKFILSNPSPRVLDVGTWGVSVGPGLGTIATEQKENLKMTRSLALLKGENGLAGKVDVFKTPGAHQGEYQWTAVDNRYFLAALIIPQGSAAVESRLPAQTILELPGFLLKPGESRAIEIPYYFGAKGNSWLSHYNMGLERAIDFGFFAQLGRFILKILTGIQGYTHNWGWSIIVLTMLIQTLLFPLTFKSLKAMNALKKLQPEIAKLQQRYSKDPTRLNSEMMELYKKHGANPLSGCLPLLVQTPIFYALYTALRNAWELHGTGWIFWIKDLSAKDPFYVLPVVMGGVMFFQNKMNPAQGDPSQAQVMMWMPVIFTFMFLNFPSGLVLYWLTNSLISATLQLILRQRMNAEKA